MSVSVLCLLLFSQSTLSQTQSEPQREQLLNGLDILLWPTPGSPDVLLKLRIHSGAAFDLSGKAGEMALLGDLLFPDQATVDFFSEEMRGKLDVHVNYDSITVTMVGKVDEFEQIVQVLRNALVATQLSPEVVNKVRDARVKLIRDTAISSSMLADRAIAARLFGDFPYGRPSGGTPEDLARVARGDLMLAKERFLNSNNATLAIAGGVTKARAIRTVRQLLGPWRKSEQIVPTTFRQPKAVDERTLIVGTVGQDADVRLAFRGVARSDADFFAASVLARVTQHRWTAGTPALATKPVFVRSDSFVLPGIFVMGAGTEAAKVADTILGAKKVLESIVSNPVTQAELDRAKSELLTETNAMLSRPDAFPDPWLDVDTYRLGTVQRAPQVIQGVTTTDVQRVANRLFKGASIATVVAGHPDNLKAALQGHLQFEVLGEPVPPAPAAKPATNPVRNDNPF